MQYKLVTVIAVMCVAIVSVTAQSTPTQTGAAQTKVRDDAILEELRQMRILLERLVTQMPTPSQQTPQAPPQTMTQVSLPAIAGESIGNKDAPLLMVEFTDLQCPFCRDFHLNAFAGIKKDWIDTGKLRFVTKDLPIERLHPLATTAAKASRCAGEQGMFWEMRHSILANNANLGTPSFLTFAQELRLDRMRFDDCMTRELVSVVDELAAVRRDAAAAGITGTPSFVIGRNTIGPFQGTKVVGALPYSVFDATLKHFL